ncbi:MAG: DUF4835 family protein [Bacteroidetes bacterium]|nr:DUF4835 family protein [Bacteroidota bacterium]
MRKIILLLLLTGVGLSMFGQDLNCVVTVNAEKVTQTDPKIFKTMETSIFEFMNTRKWSDDIFKPEERIECQILITITEELSSDKFKAQASVVSRRPVYGSDYNSTLLNFVDKDFEFNYAEYQPLEYNDNQYTSNLTAMLAYYAYMIIGLDYDSFAQKGGDKYFLKAQTIVNQASNSDSKGWKSFDGTRNRYWYVTNILDPKFAGIRDAIYQYHRQGLDQMYNDQTKPITIVTKALQTLDNTNRTSPNSMFVQLFFSAKSDELLGLYSKATPAEKSKAVSYLTRLDPVNADNYQELLTGK